MPDLRVRVDIVFTGSRVAVSIDGYFWPGCPDHGSQPKANSAYWAPKLRRNTERDRLVTDRFTAAGWTVVHLWEHVAVEEAVYVVHAVVERAGSGRPNES